MPSNNPISTGRISASIEIDDRPEICDNCTKLVEASNLELVLCGGQHVGLQKPSYVWRLRPKDEVAKEHQRTKDLQRLASACRLIHQLRDHVTDSEMLQRIETFLTKQ